MNTNVWSQLPNAAHIDWVFKSVKYNPEVWEAAWYENFNAVRLAALSAAGYAARDAIQDADLYEVYDKITYIMINLKINCGDPSLDCRAQLTAIRALIAYDDCEQYLAMTYEELKVYAILSERPQAILLLPMKWVQEYEFLVTPV